MKLLAEVERKMADVLAKYLITEGGEVNPGERVVGTLPEDLLRLYGLHLQEIDEIGSLHRAHELAHATRRTSDDSCEMFRDQLDWKVRQQDALVKFFWTAVRFEFNILNDSIGIRAHARVVAWKDDPAQIVASATKDPAVKPPHTCGGARTWPRSSE